MGMRAFVVSCSLATSACSPAEGPFVEPRIAQPTAEQLSGGLVSGTFVLSLYLPSDASGPSEVFLYALQGSIHADAQSQTELPVVLEPGELVRVPIDFAVRGGGCPLTLTGTIYDGLKDGLTSTTGPSANCR
jgi:hypothetical protein